MSEYSIVDSAVQLGARVVDLDTGELIASGGVLAGEGSPGGYPRERGIPGGCVSGGAPLPAVGLSTAHISTVEQTENKDKPAALIGWVGGSLLKVQHAGPYNLPGVGGGRRGKIKGFTRSSRRNFQRMMATVEKGHLPIFVTLTYPDEFPGSLADMSCHFERLRSRLARKGWGAIWRREYKTRKSGKNAGRVAAHYHLLVWGASYKDVLTYIPAAWYACVGSGDEKHLHAGTRVEVLRDWGGVAGYVSKYMAKTEDLPELEDGESVGRFWGVINRDVIPWAEAIVMTIDNTVVNTFFRYMRRFAGLRARGSWPSLTIFVNDPWKWLEAAAKH